MEKNEFSAHSFKLNCGITFLNDIKRLAGRDRYLKFLDLMTDITPAIRRLGIDSLDKRETVKKVYDLIGDHEDLMRTFFEYLPFQDAMDACDVQKRGKHDPSKVDLNCNDVKGEPSEKEPGHDKPGQEKSDQEKPGQEKPGQEARNIDDPRSDQSDVENSVLQKAIGVFRKLIDIVETILNNKEGDSSQIEAEIHRLVDEVRLVTDKDFSEDSCAKKDFFAISSDVVKAVGEVVQIVEKEFPNTNSKASSELKVVEKDIKRAKVHRLVEKIRHKTEKDFFKNSCAKKDLGTISSDVVKAVEDVVKIVEKEYPDIMLLGSCNSKASSELKVVEEDILKEFS